MSALTLHVKALHQAIFGKKNTEPLITATEALRHETINQYLRDMLAQANAQIQQLKFLLDCAPMIDFDPKDFNIKAKLRSMRSGYIYIHPKTLAPLTDGFTRRVYVFPGSPTVWVPVSSMPEGRIICSSLPLPGVEKF